MDKKTVSLIGVPMDLGGNRRGVDMGGAFRIAGIEPGVRALGHEFVDRGNVPVGDPRGQEPVDARAKYLPTIAEACGRSRTWSGRPWPRFSRSSSEGPPIAVGTVAGVAEHFDARGERIRSSGSMRMLT